MTYYITPTKSGKASFEGCSPFEFDKCHLTRYGLSISRFKRKDIDSTSSGPHFSFSVINSTLLREMIVSHLSSGLPLPCTYQFLGPVLGRFRECSGYDAASSGGNGRPIEQITMIGNLNQYGLSIEINGVAGYIFEDDCGSKGQQFTKKNFSVSLIIDPLYLPPVIDIRTHGNIFERRFLGTDEPTKTFPKVVEP
ncbi:MAG: hypothetical protein F9K30_05225 [Dechloromonas sp.]|nr:MAG: hypothetical protein F9K30_05225 [Dechloromonas sp.]